MRSTRKLLEVLRMYHEGTRITMPMQITPRIILMSVPEAKISQAKMAMYTSAVPTSGCSTISTSGKAR